VKDLAVRLAESDHGIYRKLIGGDAGLGDDCRAIVFKVGEGLFEDFTHDRSSD
jgi:hypothetical protein